MTKERITAFQRITPWASLILTVGGASYSVFISGNIYSYLVTLTGVAVGALDKHLSAEKAKIERTVREEAEAKLNAVTERVADRIISADAQTHFIASLQNAPKGKVWMSVTMQDPETARFMNVIARLLMEAGYEVPRSAGLKMEGPSFGTALEVPDPLPDEHYAVPLISALARLDPFFQIKTSKSKSAGISMIVGGKPQAQ